MYIYIHTYIHTYTLLSFICMCLSGCSKIDFNIPYAYYTQAFVLFL